MLSGLVLSHGGIAIIICMPVVGMLLRRYQPAWLAIFGVLVSSAGMLALSRFTLQIDFATAVRSRVVQNLGLAFLFVPVSTAAVANIAKERTNYAGGLFNLARNIGGSSGIAAGTTLLARRWQFHQHVLVSHLTPYDLPLREALIRASSILQVRAGSAPDAAIQAHGLLYGTMHRESSMLAFSDAFWVMAVLFRPLRRSCFL